MYIIPQHIVVFNSFYQKSFVFFEDKQLSACAFAVENRLYVGKFDDKKLKKWKMWENMRFFEKIFCEMLSFL